MVNTISSEHASSVMAKGKPQPRPAPSGLDCTSRTANENGIMFQRRHQEASPSGACQSKLPVVGIDTGVS